MQIKSNKFAFVWNNKQLYSYFEDIFSSELVSSHRKEETIFEVLLTVYK